MEEAISLCAHMKACREITANLIKFLEEIRGELYQLAGMLYTFQNGKTFGVRRMEQQTRKTHRRLGKARRNTANQNLPG